jgi:predicted TIM-barrel fold metal-dependent hydrolase
LSSSASSATPEATMTRDRVLARLLQGPARLSDLKAAASTTTSAVRNSVARLRKLGWKITCFRDPANDPKYELMRNLP